jgi:hypothetical protein
MKKISLLILVFLLCGCATNLTNVRSDYSFNYAAGNNLVIGKIYLRGFRNIYKQAYINLVQKESKKNFNLHLNESTCWQRLFPHEKEVALYFFVELPPGEYEVKQITLAQEWNIYSPAIKFIISQDKNIYYIGTLEIVRSGGTNFWTMQSPVNLYILDEYEEAAKAFKAKYPQIKEEIKIDLMTMSQ